MGKIRRPDATRDVRRLALPRSLPVFLRKDLAVRYGVQQSTIGDWVTSGLIPPEDVSDAEGIPLGWTWTLVSLNEMHAPRLLDAFRENQVVPDVRVGADAPG